MRLENVVAYGFTLFAVACGLLGWLTIEGLIWLEGVLWP